MTVPVLINRGARKAGESEQRAAKALTDAGIDGKIERLDREQLARGSKSSSLPVPSS